MSKKIYIVLSILLVWLLSCCKVNAWSCSSEWNIWEGICSSLSNWYTEPYCSEWIETDSTQCIWTMNSIVLNSDKNTSERGFIEKYCSALLSTWQEKWRIYFAKPSAEENDLWWDWKQTFDSRQSIFVYALCSSFEDKEWNTPFIKTESNLSEIFKWNWDIAKILKLKQLSQWEDKCSWDEKNQLNECDMSIYATEIFSAIMSDVFKIKYAQVFSVDSSENFFDVKKRITSFFSWYFFIVDDYEKIKKQYPQTVNVLDSNQKYYKSVLEKLKILNNTELADIDDNTCITSWNVAWKDFIKCAMHGTQWKWLALDPSFITLLYNEVLNYQVFEKAYQSRLSGKIPWSEEKQWRIYQTKILDFQFYANKQIDAVYNTLHDLEELNMTYPLHIWLLLYQEKVKIFRDKALPPVVTLFYSLSEKLQNVQIP